MKCTVCDYRSESKLFTDLSQHFLDQATKSDADHVMWLNRYITSKRTDAEALAEKLSNFFSIGEGNLGEWIVRKFIDNFFMEPPHPFIAAMQIPGRKVLAGYAMEHHHFLKQWIRSCAFIVARTDREDVQMYELDNIMTEMHGYGRDQPSHHELLLRMGQDLGISRDSIINSEPLDSTKSAIELWNHVAETYPWIEAMAAMHPLELIATRGLEKKGAIYSYFSPDLFSRDDLPDSAKEFLREGYEADASHSGEALHLIEKYAEIYGDMQAIQATFIRSMVAFDSYLNARLKRGDMLEDKL